MNIYTCVVKQLEDLDRSADEWIKYLLEPGREMGEKEWEYVKNTASQCHSFSMSLWGGLAVLSDCDLVDISDREEPGRDVWEEGYKLFRKNIDKWSRVISIVNWKTGLTDHENGPEPSIPC